MISKISSISRNINQASFQTFKGRLQPGMYAPFRMTPPPTTDTFEKRTKDVKTQNGNKAKSSAHPFRKISYNKAKNMLTVENIKTVQDFMRQTNVPLNLTSPADKNPVIEGMFEIDGQKYDARFSGGGGTKNVFQIECDGKKYALALPTYVDRPDVAGNKWLDVLEYEPKNTAFLRQQGFKTNDIFDIVPVKVAGVEFPAVLMKPYSEHSYDVGDRKNYSFANLLSFEEINTLNDKIFFDLYKDIPKEIAKLTALGIEPHYDCVNLCRQKADPKNPGTRGGFHLYLNDLDKQLGKNARGKLSEKEAKRYIKSYTYLVISALPETVDRNLKQWCDYFVFIEANDHIREEIETMALEEYRKLKK